MAVRPAHRVLPGVIRLLRIGMALQQRAHRLGLVAAGGEHQRRHAFDVGRIGRCMRGQQQADDVDATALRRPMERRVAELVARLDLRAVIEQHAGDGDGVRHRRMRQRAAPFAVDGVGTAARRERIGDAVGIAVERLLQHGAVVIGMAEKRQRLGYLGNAGERHRRIGRVGAAGRRDGDEHDHKECAKQNGDHAESPPMPRPQASVRFAAATRARRRRATASRRSAAALG